VISNPSGTVEGKLRENEKKKGKAFGVRRVHLRKEVRKDLFGGGEKGVHLLFPQKKGGSVGYSFCQNFLYGGKEKEPTRERKNLQGGKKEPACWEKKKR